MDYVVGFCFNARFSKVALILKNKPDWQKGYYNGIGGKIENNETPSHAMQREFFEEAGLNLGQTLWNKFLILNFDYGTVHFFCTRINDESFKKIKARTSETIKKADVRELSYLKTIPKSNRPMHPQAKTA